jgi:opacity protein-like surface antigen
MPKKAGTVLLSLLLATWIVSATMVLAQDQGRFEASIAAAGVLPKESTGNGTTLNPTNSAAFVASFRYRFNPRHSVEVNYARTADSQLYTLGVNQFRVMSKISEYSGAYVLNIFQRKKLEPFVFAGGGVLMFSPGNTYIDTYQLPVAVAKQTGLALLYGAGADYRVAPHIAVRLQYRGLIYKAPDFSGQNFQTSAKGNLAEPAIGIDFRF